MTAINSEDSNHYSRYESDGQSPLYPSFGIYLSKSLYHIYTTARCESLLPEVTHAMLVERPDASDHCRVRFGSSDGLFLEGKPRISQLEERKETMTRTGHCSSTSLKICLDGEA
jgi:hypothetical protein